jgi:hypothetical protein
MSDPGRGRGAPIEASSETGLAEVLSAYAIHGGTLSGARRWADNPLALTHVRWQGPSGQFLDAVRRQGDESWLGQGERETWVEVALHYPNTAVPVASGPSAPWVPLTLQRERASALSARMARPRPSGPPSGWSRSSGGPSQPASWPFPADDPGAGWVSQPRRAAPRPAGPDSSGPHSQTTGAWRFASEELVVVPCVEVDLPPAIGGTVSADFARDYARDIAVHFARAARTIPQVRDLRVWMRGDRLVLAARMVLGPGGRPLTRQDVDGAAQMLAGVLAQRTIPYARLTFAEPAEWQGGSPMPE